MSEIEENKNMLMDARDKIEEQLIPLLQGYGVDRLTPVSSNIRSRADRGYISGDCKIIQKLTMLFWLLQTNAADILLKDNFENVKTVRGSQYDVGLNVLPIIFWLITFNIEQRTYERLFNTLTNKSTIVEFLRDKNVDEGCIERIKFLYKIQIPNYYNPTRPDDVEKYTSEIREKSKIYPIPFGFGHGTTEMDHWFVIFNEKIFNVWGLGDSVVKFRAVPMVDSDGVDKFAELISIMKHMSFVGGNKRSWNDDDQQPSYDNQQPSQDKRVKYDAISFKNALQYCFLYSNNNDDVNTVLKSYEEDYKTGKDFNVWELGGYQNETYAETLLEICKELMNNKDISEDFGTLVGGGKKLRTRKRKRRIIRKKTKTRHRRKKTKMRRR
jgi:hypothetical protein